MDECSFRFATIRDIDSIMSFIGTHWKSDHILATQKDFFIYEFTQGDHVNFALAENERKEIVAIEGFIKTTHEYLNSDIFLVMWKANRQQGDPYLGVKLLNFITASGFRSVSSLGITEKTVPIYDYLGYRTGELAHYYMLNKKMKQFRVAVVNSNEVIGLGSTEKFINNSKSCEMVPILDPDSLISFGTLNNGRSRLPKKDIFYLKKRYFEHPVYKYKVFGFQNSINLHSILIMRKIAQNDSHVLRIVDFIGHENDLCGVGQSLNHLMDKEGCEYIDFYQLGISEEIMLQAGFTLRTKDDTNIIPNYFEPFVQKNISLLYFTNTKEKIYIFKGDGDQDRPNQMP